MCVETVSHASVNFIEAIGPLREVMVPLARLAAAALPRLVELKSAGLCVNS